jgi:hypothetical protein
MCYESMPDYDDRKEKPYMEGEFYVDLFHLLFVLGIAFLSWYFINFDKLSH